MIGKAYQNTLRDAVETGCVVFTLVTVGQYLFGDGLHIGFAASIAAAAALYRFATLLVKAAEPIPSETAHG